MKIEIAEPGRMTQSGSSLLKLIQNNDMPVLDLLVRESIQNSLDARKKDAKYVDVEYQTGSFDSKTLANELEGITDKLINRYDSVAKFIAVKDSNTVGLTGEINYKKVVDNDYGNLLKLIYEICKPQEAAGAGGSWGLGKTVYFRVGIGLVVYYSRIKCADGSYQSRLAASLVEKETSPDAMIPVYKSQTKRGIAWWGELIGENITQPITDEEYIKKFLDIFKIEPYEEDKTGTVIIIPFIDSDKLLNNNQIEYTTSSDEVIKPYWCKDIEAYLSIATQRWYAPRLSNSNYNRGAYLRLKINGEGIGADSMEPIFKVIRALYNRANHTTEDDDILLSDECIVKSEPITVKKYLKDQIIGNIAYAKVNKNILGMCAPNNKPSPYMYLNCEIRETETNRPIIAFTRKPGMIVSFENIGAWTSGISSSQNDEYIIGLFVLNSENELKEAPETKSVEEYIRKSEMADHTSWSDWSDGKYNPRLVNKIQRQVSNKIGQEFKTVEEATNKKNSGLGKMFGDMLLPPEGFGKGATGGKTPSATSKNKGFRGIKFEIVKEKIKYEHKSMLVPIILKASNKNKITSASFRVLIDSDVRKIEMSEWEEKMELVAPFKITDIEILVNKIDAVNISREIMLNDINDYELKDLLLKKIKTRKGTCIGLEIRSDNPISVDMEISAKVIIYKNDLKPAFAFEREA